MMSESVKFHVYGGDKQNESDDSQDDDEGKEYVSMADSTIMLKTIT